MAGALGEIANDTLKHDFRNIDPSKARILLIEATDRILPSYPPELAYQAEIALNKLGVKVRTRAMVTDINPKAVTVKRADRLETIPCRTGSGRREFKLRFWVKFSPRPPVPSWIPAEKC